MIVVGAYKGRRVGVFGLARSGLAAVRALNKGGAKVLPWDDKGEQRVLSKVKPVDLYREEFSGLSALVVSPGVPLTFPNPHPLVEKARAAGVTVIGDMELFGLTREALPDHQLVGVTGTNGKSTTTALLAHTLKVGGKKALAAGNIGIPVLDIEPLKKGGIYVFELSSFQLDQTESLKSDVAILLNVSPDHLDRHGSMEAYVAAKKHIFDMQEKTGIAVIGVDDPYGREMVGTVKGRVIPVSCEGEVKGGVFAKDGVLYDALEGKPNKVGPLGKNRSLRGKHNGQNAAAVYAAARSLGVSPNKILEAFDTFEGLPHRLEVVGEKDGIVFINDSKASNTGSALRSLEAFEKVYWIVGGLFKEKSLEMFTPVLGHVEKAFLIGEDDSVFQAYLKGKVEFEACHTLEKATLAAAKAAREEGKGIILLAPACASFDQFKNFEHRGETFRQAAKILLEGGRL